MLNMIDFFLIPNYQSIKWKIIFLSWKADCNRFICEASSAVQASKAKVDAK